MAAYTDHLVQQVVRQATAGTAQSTLFDRKAPFAGVLSSAIITPNVAVAADGSNYRTFTLYNRGQAGAGTTVMATFATTTALVDNIDIAMTLSVVANALNVAAGDRFEVVETITGTGVAHGGLVVDAGVARTDQV